MEKVKEIPLEIVFQVISLLPIKSLNRFKCVSTSWSSMIYQHRPYGRILVNITSNDTRSVPRKGLYCAPIHAPAYFQHEQIQDLNVVSVLNFIVFEIVYSLCTYLIIYMIKIPSYLQFMSIVYYALIYSLYLYY